MRSSRSTRSSCASRRCARRSISRAAPGCRSAASRTSSRGSTSGSRRSTSAAATNTRPHATIAARSPIARGVSHDPAPSDARSVRLDRRVARHIRRRHPRQLRACRRPAPARRRRDPPGAGGSAAAVQAARGRHAARAAGDQRGRDRAVRRRARRAAAAGLRRDRRRARRRAGARARRTAAPARVPRGSRRRADRDPGARSVTLAELAALDWTRLIRGFAEAATLAEAAIGPAQAMPSQAMPSQAMPSQAMPAQAMIDRMLVRAARDGAQVLAWAGKRLELRRVTLGAGSRGRARFVERAELATAPAEVPAALAQIHRAFADDADRAPALVAMFLEMGRRAEALVDQLELAGQATPALAPAARALARTLPRARLMPFKPRVRSLADFDRMRATGYVDGEPGRVVQ